jgi:hypothetical protein
MIKYEIDPGFDFYKELNESNEINDDTNNCLITGMPLTDNFIKLNCNHSFNYIPLFNDIYNSKFRTDSISSKYPNNNIKCPYCRNIQSNLIPYHEDLKLPLVYGINTNNVMYTIVKNKYNKFVYANTLSYFPGICCFSTSENYECANTSVILHNETKKTYCNAHIGIIKKEYVKYLKDIKKQTIKLQKQQEKEAIKKQKIQTELEKKIVCNQILKTGLNKGKSCNCKVYLLDKCKKHTPKENI